MNSTLKNKLSVVLYCHKKCRYHLGTKVLKTIIVLAVVLYERVCVFNGF